MHFAIMLIHIKENLTKLYYFYLQTACLCPSATTTICKGTNITITTRCFGLTFVKCSLHYLAACQRNFLFTADH